MAAAPETDIALRDGSTVHVRSVRPADADALADFYGGLSEQSRIFRFFSAGANLRKAAQRSAEARDGGGLLALHEDRVIGHAEYFRYPPASAEVAFTVADAYHGHGVTTFLLAQLADMAAAEGVATFTASVMPGNHKMVGAFRGSGFPVEVRSVEGEVEVTFPTALDDEGRRRFEDRERRAAVAAVAHVLRPASVALLGDTAAADAVRPRLAEFAAAVHDGTVPTGTELAIVAVPADRLLDAARACAAAGVRALVVLSEASGASWTAGAAARAELLRVCREAGMRLVGPGSLGVLNAAAGLDATVAAQAPPAGRIAFGSQSAALGIVALDLACRRGLGLSSFVSLGDKADLSGNDLLDHWDADDGTDVIALYLESLGNPAKFGRITRRITSRKPVLVVKSGRAAAPAAADRGSQTAALVAAEGAVDALFASAGVIRTDTLEETFDVAALLSRQPLPRGGRVAIVANARGPGIVCADACVAAGLELAVLAPQTHDAVGAAVPRATVETPVDLTAGAGAADFAAALRAVLADPGVDAVVTVFVPRLAATAAEVLEAVRAAAQGARAPVLPVFLGPDRPGPDEALPLHSSVEEAARSLGRAVRHARHRAAPEDPLPALDGVDADRAAGLVAAGLAAGGDWLPAPVAEELLACYGIRRIPTRWAASPRAVRDAALDLGGQVALHASGPGITDPKAAGVLRLGLSAAGAERAARVMRTALARAGQEVEGFVVQAMAEPGVDLLVGAVGDPRLGPLVAVAAGGPAATVTRDVQARLAPAGPRAAAEMVRGLRSRALLERRGADLAAVEDLVLRVGALAAAHPEVAELDCNPVICSPSGAVVVDAAVRLGPPPAKRPFGALDR
jgi:acyl-CoA synthetase (NDP forming)/RimJ/RimL family protein N-acetyltransferase